MKNSSKLKLIIVISILCVITKKESSAGNSSLANNFQEMAVAPPSDLSITNLVSGGCVTSHTISGNIAGTYAGSWNIYLHKDSPSGTLINQITNSTAPDFIFNVINTGNYFLTITDGICSKDYNMPITNSIPSRPLIISSFPSGNKVCPGDTFTYTTAFTNGVVYNWTMPPSAILLSGQSSNSVVVTYTSNVLNTELISVVKSNGCGSSQPRNFAVQRRSPGRPSAITGESFGLCGLHNMPYSVQLISKMTYNWIVPGVANIISGQGTNNIGVNYKPMNFQKIISVTATNGCGTSAERTLVIRSTPKKPGSITGAALVCPNSINIPYSITPVTNATGYTWSGPAGSTITANGITSLNNILTTTATSVTVNFNSITSNSYVRVKANNACGSSALSGFQITPCAITLNSTTTIDATNSECDPNCNGSATVNVSGGDPPYTYQWINDLGEVVQSAQTATGLCGGTYSVIVTDINGNTSYNVATIGGKTSFTIPPFSDVDLMFSGYCSPYCNGYINITPYPGSPGDYMYLWNNGVTTNILTGLCGYEYGDPGGDYSVVVMDSYGCTKTESYFMENHISFIALGCETTSDESSAGAADGEIEATTYHGFGPFAYQWSNGQTGSIASGLTAGTYTVTATDASFCTATTSCEVIAVSPRLGDSQFQIEIIAQPNPFIDKLNIDVITNETLNISIRDITGKIINVYPNINDSFVINMKLKNGLYFIYAENKSGTFKKVFKVVRSE